MTIKDVQESIDIIVKVKHDSELAHSYEDNLLNDVLESIADGTAENPKEMARLARTTVDIPFARWYA